MDLPTTILAGLLTVFPALPAGRAACVAHNRPTIIERAWTGSMRHGVPVSLLFTTGLLETHLGCNPRSDGNWGAPIRSAGSAALDAASSLARGWRHCGTWLGAVSSFRCGRCTCPARWYARPRASRGYSPEEAVGFASMAEDAAGMPPRAWL